MQLLLPLLLLNMASPTFQAQSLPAVHTQPIQLRFIFNVPKATEGQNRPDLYSISQS
jgi:hypothetical protein